MNKQETNIFYALIRKALFDEAINTSLWGNEWKWDPIIQALKENGLRTLTLEAILSLPHKLQPNAKDVNHLMQIMGHNLQKHDQLNKDICTVFALLESDGFQPILMKGQSIANLYPKPILRKTGDIDIYIGKDYRKATDILEKELHCKRAGHESKKHLVVCYGQTTIEIHQYAEILSMPQHNDAYQKLIDSYFAHPSQTTINRRHIPIPPEQIMPLYLFSHLWHHFRDGSVSIRQFCDFAMVLHKHKEQIDKDQLREDLKKAGLLKEWQLAGGLAVNLIGLPKKEFPFYKETDNRKIELLSDFVISDGNSGRNQSKRANKTRQEYIKHKLTIHGNRAIKLSKISMSYAVLNLAIKAKQGISNILHKNWQ